MCAFATAQMSSILTFLCHWHGSASVTAVLACWHSSGNCMKPCEASLAVLSWQVGQGIDTKALQALTMELKKIAVSWSGFGDGSLGLVFFKVLCSGRRKDIGQLRRGCRRGLEVQQHIVGQSDLWVQLARCPMNRHIASEAWAC